MLRRVVTAVVVLLSIVACGATGGGASAPTGVNSGGCTAPLRFTFRLNWVLDTEQVPYFTALDKGWYRQACLDPQFVAGNGSTITVQLVGNGSADMGVADAISIIPGQAQGLPVTAVGTVFQQNPFAIVIREAVLTPEQRSQSKLDPTVLYGKTFGAVTGGSPYVMWQAFVKQNHLDLGKIRQVAISAPGYAEMATGKVDFLANFFTAKAVLEGMGVRVRLITGQEYNQKAYGLTILVNNDFLKSHGQQVRDFLRVTIRALQYTSEHPEEGVQELCKYNASLCADQHSMQVNLEQYRETIPLYPNVGKGKPLLCIDTSTWRSTEELVKETGLVTSIPDPTRSFTNAYLSGC